MIVKKLWTELVTQNELDIIDNDMLSLAGQIDTLMASKFSITTSFQSYLNYIKTAFFSSEGNNQWSGLQIYLSSYSFGDKRFKMLMADKIRKYFAFYIKFITDEGLAKTITTTRNYEDHSGTSSTNNNIHSELPQIELDNFENGIKYASTLDKDTSSLSGNSHGEAGETKREVTWDEAMSNLRTMLFNDLIDYVTRIPNLMFNHYSTDTVPFTEMIKATCKYIKNLSDLYKL